jgi:hypothetical protein
MTVAEFLAEADVELATLQQVLDTAQHALDVADRTQRVGRRIRRLVRRIALLVAVALVSAGAVYAVRALRARRSAATSAERSDVYGAAEPRGATPSTPGGDGRPGAG